MTNETEKTGTAAEFRTEAVRLLEKAGAVSSHPNNDRDRWVAMAAVYAELAKTAQEEPTGTYCACADPECPTPDGQYTHG